MSCVCYGIGGISASKAIMIRTLGAEPLAMLEGEFS